MKAWNGGRLPTDKINGLCPIALPETSRRSWRRPLKEASHGMGLPRFDAETSYAEITDDGLRNPAGLEEDHDTANNIIRR